MRPVMIMLSSTAALQMPALQVPWKRAARVRQESAAVSSDTVLKHGLEVAMLKTVLGSSAVDENGCRISRTKQAKQLFKRYGAAYLTTSISLSLISYWLCWSAVVNGVDVVGLLRRFGLSAVVSPTAGTGTIAYVAHKAASPIRFPPTVALTPIVSQKLFGRAL